MTTRFEGELPITIKEYLTKGDNTNDGKTSFVKAIAVLDRNEAVTLGGEAFATGLFSSFVGDSAHRLHSAVELASDLCPDEVHAVAFRVGGKEHEAQVKPEITKVSLSGKERLVTLSLKFAIPYHFKTLRSALDDNVHVDGPEVVFRGVVQEGLFDPETETEAA